MSSETANGDNAAQQAQGDRRSRREAAAAQFLHSGGRSIDKGGDPDDWQTPSKEYAHRTQRDWDNRQAALKGNPPGERQKRGAANNATQRTDADVLFGRSASDHDASRAGTNGYGDH